MQVPFVMMLALTGLGCHNNPSVTADAILFTGYQVDASPLAVEHGIGSTVDTNGGLFAPTPYPDIPARVYASDIQPRRTDWHAALRSTLCSFVLGHDPDVRTVRDIEASVYGVNSGW